MTTRKDVKKKLMLNGFFSILLIAFLIFLLIEFNSIKKADGEKTHVLIFDPLFQLNSSFQKQIVARLEENGVTVESRLGSNFTLNYLKGLRTTHDILVLRVHSAVYNGQVWILTGERYDLGNHIVEQMLEEVKMATPDYESRNVFSFGSDFINHYMNNYFDNTIILMMGCNGLSYYDLAESFIDNGALVFIGWNGPVSLTHTDKAFKRLIQALTEEGLSVQDAVIITNKDIGKDPEHDSLLTYYPLDKGHVKITKTW